MIGGLVRHFRFSRAARIAQIMMIVVLAAVFSSCSLKRPGMGGQIPPVSEIQDIRVTEGLEKTVIEVEGEEPMIYTSFRLSNPDRLVIDLPEVSLARFSDKITMRNGPIRAIHASTGNGSSLARLELELNGSVEIDVRTEGLILVVEATQVTEVKDGFFFFQDETENAMLSAEPSEETALVADLEGLATEDQAVFKSDPPGNGGNILGELSASPVTSEIAEAPVSLASDVTPNLPMASPAGMGEMDTLSDFESAEVSLSEGSEADLIEKTDVSSPEMHETNGFAKAEGSDLGMHETNGFEKSEAPGSLESGLLPDSESFDTDRKPNTEILTEASPDFFEEDQTLPLSLASIPLREAPSEPAKKVSGLRFDQSDGLKLVMTADGLLHPRTFFIGEEANRRLVIDLPNVTRTFNFNRLAVNNSSVKQVRVGQHEKKLRLVLDLLSPITYSLLQDGPDLVIVITNPSEKETPEVLEVQETEELFPPGFFEEDEEAIRDVSSEELPIEKEIFAAADVDEVIENENISESVPETTDIAASDAKPILTPIPTPGFAAEQSLVPVLPLPDPAVLLEPEVPFQEETLPQNKVETEEIPIPEIKEKTELPPDIEPPSFSETPPPLLVVDAPIVRETEDVVEVQEEITEEEAEKDAKKKVLLRRKRREAAALKREAVANAEVETASEQSASSETPKYTGRMISLDFQDALIADVIRLIADVSGLNFIMGDDVQGKMNLKLNNVPWDQALEIILEIRNLGMVREGNIIRISTLANLTKQRNEKADARETKIRAEKLDTRVLYINYAKSEEMKALLLKLLSSRGEIMVAARVNALVVKDIKENLDQIEEMAKELDTKTPQVLIEARVVEIQPTFKQSLGVKWGADIQTNQGGNRIGIGNATSSGSVFSPGQDFAVNLPAANPLGGVGFTFGRFTESPFQLDLRISAGESQEMTRIVSTPKIMVLDNNEALIKQGKQIPFLSSSPNGGTNVQLIDASLQLKVTPHISKDGGILLELNLTKNENGPPVQGSDQPTIFEKEVSTQVLLMDGETMVIGGIYETKKSESESGIPYLKDIPGLGWLFKNKEKSESTTELLIFITPTIME